MVAILPFHDCYAPGQNIVGVIRHMPEGQSLQLRMLGAALVYDRTRANPKHFNATHWIGHASAMEHGTIFFDLKIPFGKADGKADENGLVHFRTTLPESMLPSFSSAYNTAFVTVSYGLCLHSENGEVLAVEPVTVTQNAPEESGRMNKKTRLATFVTRSNWHQNNNNSYLAATVDMDEVDNLTSGSTLSLRLHARSMQQVKSLRFTVEQRLELSLPYNGQPRRVKQKAVIASSIRELSSTSPSEFKKRYFITMPTLCTTINSPIISTRYTVRIQMTSTQVPVLTLEVPVTMYSKGSFINGLPSPMSNPGLTPDWAKVILDCHRKRFVDECAICFSEISHNFRLHDTAVAAAGDAADDVVSCGTSESEHSVAEESGARVTIEGGGSIKASSGKVTGDNWPAAAGGGGSAAGTPVSAAAAAAAAAALQQQFAATCDPAAATVLEDGSDGEAAEAQVVRLDDGRHPDTIADDIMKQRQQACSESQLQFLYKTCRYREHAMTRGVAYVSCGHAFHPLCLLEYEKHAQQHAEATSKCPLCRQQYSVRHFIPDDNLRSLCLERTISEAIVLAEAVAAEAEDKAKDAAAARARAAAAARHAAVLRRQAGGAFTSPEMMERLQNLLAAAQDPGVPAAPALTLGGAEEEASALTRLSLGGADGPGAAGRPMDALLAARRLSASASQEGMGAAVAAATAAHTHERVSQTSVGGGTGGGSTGGGITGSVAVAAVTTQAAVPAPLPSAGSGVAVAGMPARVGLAPGIAAPAVVGAADVPVPAAPRPHGIEPGNHVPVHEQIASMRISSEAEAAALQHPEVVLGTADPEEADL